MQRFVELNLSSNPTQQSVKLDGQLVHHCAGVEVRMYPMDLTHVTLFLNQEVVVKGLANVITRAHEFDDTLLATSFQSAMHELYPNFDPSQDAQCAAVMREAIDRLINTLV